MKRKRSLFTALLIFFMAATALAINFGLTGLMNQVFEYTGFYGDGADGALTVSGVTNGPTNPYLVNTVKTYLTANAAANATNLTVNSAISFAVGDDILIIQMKGANAGVYEFNTVTAKTLGSITLGTKTTQAYTSADKVQVIVVPRYTNLTLNSGAQMSVSAWNGNVGGVLAIKVSSILDLNDGAGGLAAHISAGASTSAGYLTPAGFTGGASGTPAESAFLLNASPNSSDSASTTPGAPIRLMMGSGGAGATTGYRGGGIVIIKAKQIKLGGTIDAMTEDYLTANNIPGAGGTVFIAVDDLNKGTYTSCGKIDVNGGADSAGTYNSTNDGRAFIHYITNLGTGCASIITPAAHGTIRKAYLQ